MFTAIDFLIVIIVGAKQQNELESQVCHTSNTIILTQENLNSKNIMHVPYFKP